MNFIDERDPLVWYNAMHSSRNYMYHVIAGLRYFTIVSGEWQLFYELGHLRGEAVRLNRATTSITHARATITDEVAPRRSP